jgi:hypothetical protein
LNESPPCALEKILLEFYQLGIPSVSTKSSPTNMPDYIVCTRAIKGGSFSSEPGPTRFLKVPDKWNPDPSHEISSPAPYDSVLKLSNVKRVEVAPRAGRVGLPHDALAKAVSVDCGARFLKTNPVVDPISHGWYFDDPVFLKNLTYTLAGDMDRNVIPTCVTTPSSVSTGQQCRSNFRIHPFQLRHERFS